MAHDPDEPFTLVFIGHADDATSERASAYEDRVLALLDDHGARLLYRGRRVEPDHELPLEVHLIRFPHRRAFDAFMADGRRLALTEEYGEVFTRKQIAEMDTLAGLG